MSPSADCSVSSVRPGRGFPTRLRLFKNQWKKKGTLSGGKRFPTLKTSGAFCEASAILRKSVLDVGREEGLLSARYAHAARRKVSMHACLVRSIPVTEFANLPEDIPHCCQMECVSTKSGWKNGLKNRKPGLKEGWYILISAVTRMKFPRISGSLRQTRGFIQERFEERGSSRMSQVLR